MKKPIHQRIATYMTWIFGGLLALGTFLDAIANAFSLVTPLVTYVGTIVLLLVLVLAHFVLNRRPIDWVTNGQLIHIKGLRLGTVLPIIGMVILLWIPRLQERVLVELSSSAKSQKETSNTTTPLQCSAQILHGFGNIWYNNPEVSQGLGCPQTEERTNPIAYQQFEGGTMLWVSIDVPNADAVYALFLDGYYQKFSGLEDVPSPHSDSTQREQYQIGDLFGGAYWRGTGSHTAERLGSPISHQTYENGTYQIFENGRMLWVQQLDQIFVIYDFSGNSNRWESFPDTYDVFAVPRQGQ